MCGETIPPRNLLRRTKAINYDDYEGVIIGENTEGGDSVIPSAPYSWIRYDHAALEDRATSFVARVMSAGNAVIDVRLNGPEGLLVASCRLNEEDIGWRTVTSDIHERLEGIHNICLVLKGDMKLSWFHFSM